MPTGVAGIFLAKCNRTAPQNHRKQNSNQPSHPQVGPHRHPRRINQC